MGVTSSSPTNIYYLSALRVPQQIRESVLSLQNLLHSDFGIASPLPPLLPLRVDRTRPSEPVTGCLPVADHPVDLGRLDMETARTTGDSWIFWTCAAGTWPEQLAASLGRRINGEAEGLFPMRRGIPLAVLASRPTDSEKSRILRTINNHPAVREQLGNNSGWRTMELACWEITCLQDRPWYKATAWQMKWRRRLKRAPKAANINKNT